MKKLIIYPALVAVVVTLFSFIGSGPGAELTLNAALPMADAKMKDVSGKTVSLAESKTAKGLLVIFSCNTCPYVKLSEKRIKEYSDYCLSNGIGCIIINSNEAQRTEADSFEEMNKYYKAQALKCAYVVDEKSAVADAFGATRTPQCFLFNAKGLAYKGAIDDNVKDAAAVKAPYLKDALAAVAKGETPKMQETKSIGCTIKRVE
ncbi:MAG: thioredoxin family protein [Bacteroidia bacterium]|nr:thioredoxin family protein [Bacteroidia bacterium]